MFLGVILPRPGRQAVAQVAEECASWLHQSYIRRPPCAWTSVRSFWWRDA